MNAQSNQNNAQILFTNAMKKYNSGRYADVKKICKKILRGNPNDANTLNLLAVSYTNTGQPQKALPHMERAYNSNPANSEFQNNLSSIYAMNVSVLSKKIINEEYTHNEMMRFAKILKNVTFDVPNDETPIVKKAVLKCLKNNKIPNALLAQAYLSLLMQASEFQEILEFAQNDNIKICLKKLEDGVYTKWLNDPFTCAGLKNFAILGAHYEQIMTMLRHCFFNVPDKIKAQHLEFLIALAHQCDLNEYVYFITKHEKEKIAQLIEKFEINTNHFNEELFANIALIACYKNLKTLNNAAKISESAQKVSNQEFKNLITLQIDNPSLREHLKLELETLTPIKNKVSKNVQEQYEKNPYPRWNIIIPPDLTKDQIKKGENLNILVAGCGTGQELVSIANHYPKANVTGIDLSLSSLAYTQQKINELGIKNAKILQADILEVHKLNQHFDLITSGGVLHHMQNPNAGWKALLSVLKDSGAMKIELYSEIARQSVVLCREWIKEQGLKATPDDMRKLRQDIMMMNDDSPLKKIQTFEDFSYMSMLRDLVFHAQEHRFTLPQLENILHDLDLSLISLTCKKTGIMPIYFKKYPDDPNSTNLKNWHQFETENPDIFKTMYSLSFNKGPTRKKPDWLYIK